MIALDDKQTNCVNKLSSVKVGALFMDAGFGKTLPAYHLAQSIKDKDYVLYLAPYQTIHNKLSDENVVTEIAKYGGFDCNHDFIGIESLSASDRIYLEVYNKLSKSKKPVIICDESIKIKNLNAKRTKRILGLSQFAEYKIILNGTPITRNILDLYTQMYFLSPKILNMSSSEFKNTFCEWTKITTIVGRKRHEREYINKYHNLEYLYSLIKPYVFDAVYEIGVKLQFIDVPYFLDDCKMDEYNAIKEKYLDNEKLMAMNNNIFLEMTQKMQHLYSCTNDKFTVLDKIIKENPNDTIIVVAKFIDSQNALHERYKDFKNVQIASLKKHAFGLNLQHANRMIIWDKDWDFGLIYQMFKRIYRRNQKRDCIVMYLNSNVGLEQLFLKNLDKKGKELDMLMKLSVKQLKEVL